MSFASLQHSRAGRSTCRGRCLPATFRPQGLVTLSTAFSLTAPAGFVSRRRRSWDLPFGAFTSREVPACFHASSPTYRFVQRYSRRRSAGPARWTSVSGPRPSRESLAADMCLARRPPVAPLGFALLGPSRAPLATDFAAAPLARLRLRPPKRRLLCATESRSGPAWSCPLPLPKQRTGQNSPFRVSAPYAPGHSNVPAFGLWVHLAPRRALLPTVRRS
jgi:hypothetical protein